MGKDISSYSSADGRKLVFLLLAGPCVSILFTVSEHVLPNPIFLLPFPLPPFLKFLFSARAVPFPGLRTFPWSYPCLPLIVNIRGWKAFNVFHWLVYRNSQWVHPTFYWLAKINISHQNLHFYGRRSRTQSLAGVGDHCCPLRVH